MYLYILYLLYLHAFIVAQTCSLVFKAFRKAFRKSSRGGPSAHRRHDPLCAAVVALCHCRYGKSSRTSSRNEP